MKTNYRISYLSEYQEDNYYTFQCGIELLPIPEGNLNLDFKDLKETLKETWEENKEHIVNKCALIIKELAVETSLDAGKSDRAEKFKNLKFSVTSIEVTFETNHDMMYITIYYKPSMYPVIYADFENETIIYKENLSVEEAKED